MMRSRSAKKPNSSRQKGVSNGRLGADPVAFEGMRYKGPIHIPMAEQQVLTQKINGTYQVAATTSGGGAIDLVFGNSPAVLNDWATLAGSWHEYRVLGMELKYVPIKLVASWSYGPAHVTVDRKSSAALGAITAALQHESCKVETMYSKWQRAAKSESIEDLAFVATSSPASSYYIKVYSSDNATIQTIGRFYVTYLLELRGKK